MQFFRPTAFYLARELAEIALRLKLREISPYPSNWDQMRDVKTRGCGSISSAFGPGANF
jgi:hypothetical protein